METLSNPGTLGANYVLLDTHFCSFLYIVMINKINKLAQDAFLSIVDTYVGLFLSRKKIVYEHNGNKGASFISLINS